MSEKGPAEKPTFLADPTSSIVDCTASSVHLQIPNCIKSQESSAGGQSSNFDQYHDLVELSNQPKSEKVASSSRSNFTSFAQSSRQLLENKSGAQTVSEREKRRLSRENSIQKTLAAIDYLDKQKSGSLSRVEEEKDSRIENSRNDEQQLTATNLKNNSTGGKSSRLS